MTNHPILRFRLCSMKINAQLIIAVFPVLMMRVDSGSSYKLYLFKWPQHKMAFDYKVLITLFLGNNRSIFILYGLAYINALSKYVIKVRFDKGNAQGGLRHVVFVHYT